MHYLINYGMKEYHFKEKINIYSSLFCFSLVDVFFYTLTDFDNKCRRQLTLGAWLYQN